MTTKLPILRSPIPDAETSTNGRTLTRAEMDDLRAAGISVGARWRVMRSHDSASHRGHLYYPVGTGGYSSYGDVVLMTRDG